jgi:hypothetical protein
MTSRLIALAQRMGEAAGAWLSSLGSEQRTRAAFGFPASEERTRWYYTPSDQGGLPLVEMDPAQQHLAHRLVATGLSRPGYNAAATIMGLENVLDIVEGSDRGYPGRPAPSRFRDPQMYYLSVFGDPAGESWGWRVGGHHLALSYTIVAGQVATGPVFLGANPAVSPLVGPGELRPLAGEENLGRELLRSLAEEQRAAALLATTAPADILQANRPRVDPGALRGPSGLAAERMTEAQRSLLVALVHQYLDRLPAEIAAIRAERVSGEALATLYFGWAGGAEPGQPHYYRVQGPRLLIEYDNTQNRANHIHSVLRDPLGDFGAALLGDA